MKSFRHGTRYGYRRKRCRCDACKAWNTAESKRYRALHPQPNGWHRYNAAHPHRPDRSS